MLTERRALIAREVLPILYVCAVEETVAEVQPWSSCHGMFMESNGEINAGDTAANRVTVNNEGGFRDDFR